MENAKKDIPGADTTAQTASEKTPLTLHVSAGREGNDLNFVLDIPLLIETDAKNLVDKIIVVKSDKKNVFSRLKNKYSKEKIERILNNQASLKEKLKHADFVVDNNATAKGLELQVKRIISKLKK